MADEKVKLNRVYKDIDMAFGLNPVSSDIGKKIDVNAVKQSIKNLLLTKPFERKFNPNLASPLNRFLFELATPTTRPMMIRAIEETIVHHLGHFKKYIIDLLTLDQNGR